MKHLWISKMLIVSAGNCNSLKVIVNLFSLDFSREKRFTITSNPVLFSNY